MLRLGFLKKKNKKNTDRQGPDRQGPLLLLLVVFFLLGLCRTVFYNSLCSDLGDTYLIRLPPGTHWLIRLLKGPLKAT